MIYRNLNKILNITGGIGMIISYPSFGVCLDMSHKIYESDNPNYIKIATIMSVPFILNFGGLYMFRMSV